MSKSGDIIGWLLIQNVGQIRVVMLYHNGLAILDPDWDLHTKVTVGAVIMYLHSNEILSINTLRPYKFLHQGHPLLSTIQ